MTETPHRDIEAQFPATMNNTDNNPELLDRFQRNWIIKLELDRPFASMPKICQSKFVITDREPIDGDIVSKEYPLTTSVPPYRDFEIQVARSATSANSPESTELEITHEVLDKAEEPSESESGYVYHSSDDFQFAEYTNTSPPTDDIFAYIPWPTEEEWGEAEDAEVVPSKPLISKEIPYDPLGLIPKHTFVHCRVDGLETWNGDFVTVFVGYQEIEFMVPKFLLADNFEFFRISFQVGKRQWVEGGQQLVRLGEESPVDFVLLLRFLLHSITTDLDDLDDPCLPFWPDTNPSKPNEEYEKREDQRLSMKPWVLRLVAMAERLCFRGPVHRLTSVLRSTLHVSPTNRITTALMDWVFDHSLEGSILRSFIYDRLLESLIEGDVDPEVYREYAEEDPRLVELLHEGMLERKGLKMGFPRTDLLVYEQWLEIFNAHPIGSDGRDEVVHNLLKALMRGEMKSDTYQTLIAKTSGFEFLWERILGLHNELHWRYGFREPTDHTENDDRTGWKGCFLVRGGCAGCPPIELGGSRREFDLIVKA